MTESISIVINTFNSEKYLEEVLESVKEFDEIVICDMQSTDKTVQIAQKFYAKIVYHESVGFVEPARNFAIQSARNQWVLLLDADEVIPQALKKTIDQLLHQQEFDALAIPRKNYFMGKFMRSSFPDFNIRLFKKDKIYWPPKIHATPEINGKILKLERDKNLAIIHLVNDSISDILNKTERYTNAELLRRKPQDIASLKLIFSPMVRFIKYYFLKGGIFDGKQGLIFAALKANYKFCTLAKQYEYIKKKENENAEDHHIRSSR